MSKPRVVTQPIGGNPLATAAIGAKVPPGWYETPPTDINGWRERVESVRSQSATDWLDGLGPAFDATARAGERLRASSGGKGVVVTTGQQPGLFGGPMYTLSKSLSVLAFADSLQEITGIPVAPVFWAATDDTDFKEASATAISVLGGAQQLRIDHTEPLGRSMAAMRLGDVSAQLDALVHATGARVDGGPLELLERFYQPDETVGSSYVSFLRALLGPLGIAVLDASHAATRSVAKPILMKALECASEVSAAVTARNHEIEAAGFTPQVQDVPGLSLVFSAASGGRKRVPIKAAAKQADSDELGPNVLLRPIVERSILPTASYIGGPAEIAYFAQLAPVAETLHAPRPMIIPRWSCTVIEPQVEEILEKLYLLPEDLRDPHEAEARIARARLPRPVLDELDAMRAEVEMRTDSLSEIVAEEKAPVAPNVTAGLRANLLRRLDRFERRLIAASKREHAATMREIGTARGSLYPLGKPQERSLNFVQLLARYGAPLRELMMGEARKHARRLLDGQRADPSAALEESAQAQAL